MREQNAAHIRCLRGPDHGPEIAGILKRLQKKNSFAGCCQIGKLPLRHRHNCHDALRRHGFRNRSEDIVPYDIIGIRAGKSPLLLGKARKPRFRKKGTLQKLRVIPQQLKEHLPPFYDESLLLLAGASLS